MVTKAEHCGWCGRQLGPDPRGPKYMDTGHEEVETGHNDPPTTKVCFECRPRYYDESGWPKIDPGDYIFLEGPGGEMKVYTQCLYKHLDKWLRTRGGAA